MAGGNFVIFANKNAFISNPCLRACGNYARGYQAGNGVTSFPRLEIKNGCRRLHKGKLYKSLILAFSASEAYEMLE